MTGLIEVLRKELADYFSSLRFIILFLIILLAGIGTIFIAAQTIRTGITESTEFIFIRLFILSGKDLPDCSRNPSTATRLSMRSSLQVYR